MSPWVKICGITSEADAQMVADAGADAIGINLIPISRRYVELQHATELVRAVAQRTEVVAIVADATEARIRELLDRGFDRIQLHASEQPELVEKFQPHVYQALRIGSRSDVAHAASFAGERVLLDAKAEGQLGGTGKTFEWRWLAGLSHRRRIVLAGGLTPENVAQAQREVMAWGLDVASGVEASSDPRSKDPARVREFLRSARLGSPP